MPSGKKNFGYSMPQVKEEDVTNDPLVQSSTEEVDQETGLLRENLPLFGWVPLVFYLPSHAP
jgi:hypothetical protein